MEVSDRVVIDYAEIVYGQQGVVLENEPATIKEMRDDFILLQLKNEDAAPSWAAGTVQIIPEMLEFRPHESLEGLLEDMIEGALDAAV